VDESAITGEPQPVTKSAGDEIRSGVRILSGDLKINARQVGKQSTLGQMLAIIEKTLLTKTPLEGKTDVLLKWFVPGILALAAGTGIIAKLAGMPMAEAVLRAVTVTVISCPCALGIAIPLARVAGVSIAGKKGLLVRDFKAFEQAEAIDTIVFDKTGTVTEGKWNLMDIIPMGGFDPEQALALAAGLEKESEHFIATEIRRQSAARKIQPASVEQIVAVQGGINGCHKGRIAKIGSAAFVAQEFAGTRLASDLKKDIQRNRHSVVYLSCNGGPAAVFVFGDTLRPEIAAVIADLKNRGFNLSMISGDGHRTTTAVAESVGIETALGDQMPADKAAFVLKLQSQGHRTAMVGDGINDSPALAQADLSIAIHSGGALAREAADVSFMRGDPNQLPAFLDFAGRVNGKIHQNLVFTFLYNALAIPIAMSGWLNPLVAVSAMLLSSISVTGNTLLLVKKSSERGELS
jgi:heavy metal translocating P-type ATPase